ncbi:pyruvate phosphate dikinase [Desulfacinum hydrothermale DSM 13146]|uniref:Pyruvate phosphate dikinase n=1 Tax=Desulfacinum hydrothermale DSM 13146 TaxID=1121390 RepID=A0A1W1XSX8_9BACT|nr:PEP/pyruvate-binding domain-containing protein [Desulfacinum hydrothermale]SMC26638.1 pyruvate phosphate dikinase [Desulfacinum hydrothermale DSM 13146]
MVNRVSMRPVSAYEDVPSDAWAKNMRLTNVPVVVDPSHEVLVEAVRGYAGKEKQARELLLEYHHKYRNWDYVVEETWRYATGNLRLYKDFARSGEVVFLICRILLEALAESVNERTRTAAADHLIAFWLKIVDEAPELCREAPFRGVPAVEKLESREDKRADGAILRWCLECLRTLPSEPFACLLRGYYQPKKLVQRLPSVWHAPESLAEARGLLERILVETHTHWLHHQDPLDWIQRQTEGAWDLSSAHELFAPLRRRDHETFLKQIQALSTVHDHRQALEGMFAIPDFREVVQAYQKLPDKVASALSGDHAGHVSMLLRLRIMETKGLEAVHEETLRDINFDLSRWIREEGEQTLRSRLHRLLTVLKGCLENYPEAALQCVRTIGLEILATDDADLIEFFLRRVIRLGFQAPNLRGVTQHWQVQVNSAHLLNVRIWLELIKKNPKRTKSLLSALIVNLFLGGIYVRDTDLFQKDVSQLLHAPIGPIYNLVKQLAKLFPVYFNEIGAEGMLRTVSTDVDEITDRSDPLIHFLRKQSHVESNNLIVFFIEAIFRFWLTLDKEPLQRFVPPEVYREVDPSGIHVVEMHRIFRHLFSHTCINHVKDLLDISEEDLRRRLEAVSQVSSQEKRRAFLMIRFYQLLHEKYALSFKDIHVHLRRATQWGLPDPEGLLRVLDSGDTVAKLEAILDYLLALKEILLAPEELSYVENIYHKRHIAVDIPSMYGSYSERKFDALGLSFRLENLANLLFEELILSFNLSFITRATFFQIGRVLPLFMKALAIDGITSRRLERQEELFQCALEIRRFSHSQYMDIFRGFSEAIKQIIQSYYNSVHEGALEEVIRQLHGNDALLPRYRRQLQEEKLSDRVHRISESFLRDLVARTFGLQYFDHFISSILTTLATQKQELSTEKLDLLLSYDPEKTISLIHAPKSSTYDLIHLGNKGYNLTQLHGLGIRVPPGFVITTEYFRCRDVIDTFSQSREDFKRRVLAHIGKLEEKRGRRFGDPHRPLLLSVRSGSAVSMPGMMNTFLNVGINEKIVEGLIQETGEAWFAWDNYRRFLQSWGMSFGLERDQFDAIMASYKKRYGRKVKREFSSEEIRQLTRAYREILERYEIDISDDPEVQLFTAIRQVMESWFFPKAVTYRQIMGLSENWGTAVTIQTMVFGNLDTRSGAGVMFTHNPWTSEEEIDPQGDFTLGNQGEDVVGGLVKTLPLSEKQRLREGERKEHSLESLFPRVYQRLVDIAKELIYKQQWGPQEIEFTFQGDHEDGIYVLQSRNMAPRGRKRFPVFRPSPALKESYLASGIGVSGGALCGRAAFELSDIIRLRKDHPGEPIILIRSDTVPDDIHEISIADGILTGKGGATSHAAIVAHRLGKTCVVGCSKMRVWERDRRCLINGHFIRTGDEIGIDGHSGAIYAGRHETEQMDME